MISQQLGILQQMWLTSAFTRNKWNSKAILKFWELNIFNILHKMVWFLTKIILPTWLTDKKQKTRSWTTYENNLKDTLKDTILPQIGVIFQKPLFKSFGETLEANSNKHLLITIIANTKSSRQIRPHALFPGKLFPSFLTVLARESVRNQQ